MSLISIVLFALAIGVAVWTLLVWRGFTQVWLPEELKAASLVLVEKNIVIDMSFPAIGRRLDQLGRGCDELGRSFGMVGRPDQVYRLANGDHVPLENKNRDDHRVYDTDIAQLSLQAWLLRQTGKPTASFGYVVINSRRTRQRKSIRVDLYADAVCVRIIQRYLDVTEGRAVAKKNRGGKCKSCGHRPECHAN